jgi:uncharacterized protein
MYASPLNLLLLVLTGTATGVLGAILGTGGGVFLVPILLLAFDVPIHYAVATSIVTVIATSSAVGSTNVERGTANMRLGMTLETATSAGAIVGGLAAAWLSSRLLEGAFALVLVPTAVLMWRGRTRQTIAASQAPVHRPADGAAPYIAAYDRASLGTLGDAYYDEAEQSTIAYRVQRLPAGLAISILAGAVSGLLGIGGGIFKVPALNLVCGIPMKAAAATSNFMIGVTAAASAFLYYGRGEVRPALTAAVVLGVLAGSALGSIWNRRIRGRGARRLFALLLIAVAVQMIYKALVSGGMPNG